ncbi:hypothetical protein AB0L53_45040 [Nonomuraea sp. NPDC052129]|uniref:hypothetical protein n=1 Tax=Nonomuraea sp. NPDC052129 TaxID=3154651 RepID=UPI003448A0DF
MKERLRQLALAFVGVLILGFVALIVVIFVPESLPYVVVAVVAILVVGGILFEIFVLSDPEPPGLPPRSAHDETMERRRRDPW